jgi:hypothetical protein
MQYWKSYTLFCCRLIWGATSDWWINYRDHRVSSALSFIGGVYIGAKSVAWHKFDMVWLYRSPISAGRRGVFYSFKWFLPAFAALRGGGGGAQHPVFATHIPPLLSMPSHLRVTKRHCVPSSLTLLFLFSVLQVHVCLHLYSLKGVGRGGGGGGGKGGHNHKT